MDMLSNGFLEIQSLYYVLQFREMHAPQKKYFLFVPPPERLRPQTYQYAQNFTSLKQPSFRPHLLHLQTEQHPKLVPLHTEEQGELSSHPMHTV